MTVEHQPPELPVPSIPRWPAPETIYDHIARTLSLAGPSIVARLGILVLFTVDTLMVGRYDGNELAYLGLGLTVQMVLMMVAIGFMQGVMILTSQSFGAGRLRRCGAVWKVGIVVGGTLGVIFAFLSLITETFLVVTGQNPELVSGAATVAFHFSWGMPAMLLYIACSYFMEGITRPVYAMIAMLFANVLNVAMNWILIFGWGDLVPPMGAEGAVIATSITRWFIFFFMLWAILYTLDRRQYGLQLSFADLKQPFFWGLTGRMFRISYPMGIGQGFDAAAFSSLVLMAGLMGAAATGAYQISQNLVALVTMISIGMSAATSVRVGNAIGRREPTDVKLAGWTGIFLGVVFMVPGTIAFMAFPGFFAAAFTTSEPVIEISVGTIWVAGAMLMFGAALWVTLGALRGAGDTMMAMVLQVVPLWLISVPLGAFLAFELGFGPVGLYYGIFGGVLTSLATVVARFVVISNRLSF